MRRASVRFFRIGASLLAAAWTAHAAAGVGVEIDAETINRLLSAVAVDRVEVAVGPQRTIDVELHDLHVIGFEPAGASGGKGVILASVRVEAPELGLRVPLEPRIVVDVAHENGISLLELRFENLGLRIPLLGAIDLAALVPPMRYPADNGWVLAGAQGDVPVTSRLTAVKMGARTLRLECDVEVDPTP